EPGGPGAGRRDDHGADMQVTRAIPQRCSVVLSPSAPAASERGVPRYVERASEDVSRDKGNWAALSILLALLPGLVQCQVDNRKAVVVSLSVPGDLGVSIAQLLAAGTLNGTPSTSGPQLFLGDMVPFTLLLPPDASGLFTVDIAAAAPATSGEVPLA